MNSTKSFIFERSSRSSCQRHVIRDLCNHSEPAPTIVRKRSTPRDSTRLADPGCCAPDFFLGPACHNAPHARVEKVYCYPRPSTSENPSTAKRPLPYWISRSQSLSPVLLFSKSPPQSLSKDLPDGPASQDKPKLIGHAVNTKYVASLLRHRFKTVLSRHGIEIASQTPTL